jgi:hypothetical protein
VTQNAEGWYTDPYARHEARWMSDGIPTKLVRDGGVESYDEPPEEPPTLVPERIEDSPASQGDDLLRADDVERGDAYDPAKADRAAWDAFDENQGGGL